MKAGSSLTSERYYYSGQSTAYRPAYRPAYAPGSRYGGNIHRAEGGAPRGSSVRRAPSDTGRRPAVRPGNAGSSRPNPRNAYDGRRGAAPRSQQGAQAQRRRPAAAKRGRGIPVAAKLGALALVLALLIFGGIKLTGTIRDASVERFVDNVFVNGVQLTGMTREEGFDHMHALRDQWLNQTSTLTFQDKQFEFSPAQVNAQLNFDDQLEKAWSLGHVGSSADRKMIVKGLELAPAEFKSDPTYDEAALDKFVSGIAEQVDVAPIDAEVTLTELKPVITRASVNGWKLDQDQLKENLIELIETGKTDTQLPVNEVQPTVASEDMEMRVIAKFETDVTFRGRPSRTNVRVALEHFNLFAVYPGDTISFNEVVGPRTEAAGFMKAPEYAGSNEEMGVGGGVCQASTTLYNAIIQAGMTIIERNRHTMTVSYVEPSQDAAVNYGKKDLVFRNDTEHAIYIYTNVTKELASVTIYGTRPQYFNRLESVIIHEEASDRTGYQDDEEGKYVYYVTDPPVLYKEGHGSCESEGWIVSYDWDSKQEVSRVQVNHDVYSPGVNVYWRGVHIPDGMPTPTAEPGQWS